MHKTVIVKLPRKQIYNFRKKILSWWGKNKRDLPWRSTKNPYAIFISEIMLQQTQADRVIPKYEEFLKSFPNVEKLAAATTAQVLKKWQGLGYNRRALYLLQSAKKIVQSYNSKFPSDMHELVKLPGVGIYTAGAIAVFAYNKPRALVDTNIRQIITHFFFHDISQRSSVINEAAKQFLPKRNAWRWHQALMDYGALMLKKETKSTRNSGPKKIKKAHVPFRETTRFFRGRIVDRLRDGNVMYAYLVDEFSQKYGKPELFLQEILYGLVNDGLIAYYPNGKISLPE